VAARQIPRSSRSNADVTNSDPSVEEDAAAVATRPRRHHGQSPRQALRRNALLSLAVPARLIRFLVAEDRTAAELLDRNPSRVAPQFSAIVLPEPLYCAGRAWIDPHGTFAYRPADQVI
jgi:hypothetical protein